MDAKSDLDLDLVAEKEGDYLSTKLEEEGNELKHRLSLFQTEKRLSLIHSRDSSPTRRASSALPPLPPHTLNPRLTSLSLKIPPRYLSEVESKKPLFMKKGASFYDDILDTDNHAEFQRVYMSQIDDEEDKDTEQACSLLKKMIAMRRSYVFKKPVRYYGPLDPAKFDISYEFDPNDVITKERPKVYFDPYTNHAGDKTNHHYEMKDGVVIVYETDEIGNHSEKPQCEPHNVDKFFNDYHEMVHIVDKGVVKSYSYQRLQLLESRFSLHELLNKERELHAQQKVPHRDFYNVRKVDTHIHHSACMNQKHLLRFIKDKLKRHTNDIVIFRDGQFLTLSEVFNSLSLTAYDLSIDTLDMHADSSTFHRFDRFNLKYNPCGQSRLREIFIKTDNLLAGRYLAEITQEVFDDLESNKYSMTEYRISIYGRKRSEWNKLGMWFHVNKLASRHNRWMIQIPRLYAVYKSSGQVDSFQEIIDNIFIPLFEVTKDPTSNPSLHLFLQQVVGFDCVDDESKVELLREGQRLQRPSEWTNSENPPYAYWLYYLYANLYTLNKFRESKCLSTFSLRPHAGEAGDVNHLVSSFLLAESINHGLMLKKSAPLQYLYYLEQIGIAMSPLSNNKLFLDYHRNPFHKYFCRGLNVSLSTDDPLQLHFTKEPLVEEYVVAAQVWKMSSTDMCEIARNSVLQSGFEFPYKAHFIGENCDVEGPRGNDINLTNVPSIRLHFRHEVLQDELANIERHCSKEGGAHGSRTAVSMSPTQYAAMISNVSKREQIDSEIKLTEMKLNRLLRKKRLVSEKTSTATSSTATKNPTIA